MTDRDSLLSARQRRTYAVTLRAYAEMVVWVEAESVADAKRAALSSEYEQMTDWEPTTQKVRAVSAKPSALPDGGEVE